MITRRRFLLAAPAALGVPAVLRAGDPRRQEAAGHIHRPSFDIVNGVPQVVTEANAEGGYRDVSVIPHQARARMMGS
jgi:hypothetical protein